MLIFSAEMLVGAGSEIVKGGSGVELVGAGFGLCNLRVSTNGKRPEGDFCGEAGRLGWLSGEDLSANGERFLEGSVELERDDLGWLDDLGASSNGERAQPLLQARPVYMRAVSNSEGIRASTGRVRSDLFMAEESCSFVVVKAADGKK
jgi:hypothetical protein